MVHAIELAMSPDELRRLGGCVVRAIWTDIGDGEWIEDIVETDDGEVLISSGDPVAARVIRKLIWSLSSSNRVLVDD